MSDPGNQSPLAEATPEKPPWQPLGKIDRRTVGVLVEKAKTTPSAYPLTLNSITTAANQKSNRSPVMNLEPDHIDQSLDRLRSLGAIAEIQGDGRVLKYRHLLYKWLGVDKVEMAVMAELLLRGEQTLGELRTRAARMEPIADVAALKLIIQRLIQRNLMVALTPSGRGQIVTHNLYLPEELTRLKSNLSIPTSNSAEPSPPQAIVNQPTPTAVSTDQQHEIEQLRDEVSQLREELDKLRSELNALKTELGA